jgi:hypothetical protein
MVEVGGESDLVESSLHRAAGVEPQRRDEVLLDVEDVAAGHETKLRWNHPNAWVWSTEQVHTPIITTEEFAAVKSRCRPGYAVPHPARNDPRLGATF